jgi:uncharacterized RDD family membrane protein YckC
MIAGVAPPVTTGTHEEVQVTGRRILATLADLLIFTAVGTVMAYFFGTLAIHDAFGVEVHLSGIAWAVWIGLIAIYYILMEGDLGQTLGKVILGSKVVGEGTGEVPGLKTAAKRTVFRLVDGLASYVVALVAVLVTPNRQRLVDMAAHTLVLHK